MSYWNCFFLRKGACNNGNFTDISEEDLIEYRNIAAKEFLKISSQEKTLEAVIQALTDAINKSIIPAKESLSTIKQLTSDLFMTARLKEKAEKIANSQ